MIKNDPIVCEHPNEVPLYCPCPHDCYCKTRTCRFGSRASCDAISSNKSNKAGEKLIRLEDALRVCFETCAIISNRDTLTNDKKMFMITVANSIMTELNGVNVVKTKMPRQKPGESKQDYGTPANFLSAVVKRFGPISWDLAARADNAKAPTFFTPEQDSLKQAWCMLPGNLFINWEFGQSALWAKKCAEELDRRMELCSNGPVDRWGEDWRILALSPASIGSNWFRDHIDGKALVLALQPRLTFEGAVDPYPKDLILSVFGEKPGFEVWRWK